MKPTVGSLVSVSADDMIDGDGKRLFTIAIVGERHMGYVANLYIMHPWYDGYMNCYLEYIDDDDIILVGKKV